MSTMVNSITTVTVCYHCGQDCLQDKVLFEDKNFCCQGCKTVYEILAQNDLCEYYSIDHTPGTSLKNAFHSQKYAYLDDEATADKLLDFKNGSLSKITFQIPGMHCSSCIWLLENLHKINPGINSCRVSFLKKEAAVSFSNDKISLRKVVEILASIGYEPSITLADSQGKKKSISDKKLINQIGVAGFAFGNIMLLSLPEYFSNNDFFETYQSTFAWLNILLAIPVFFYSAQDYFKSAWGGFKTQTLNINVPIAVGFISLFAVSLVEILIFKRAGYFDSFTGLVFFLLLGKLYQQKTYQLLSFERDYKSYFPISITILKAKEEKIIPLENLKIGDKMVVKNGDLIPADSVLIKGNASIDYSFVTGEALPVTKNSGEIIFAGGRQVGEAIELEVIKEPSQSYLTQLWNNETFTKETEGDMSSLSNKISKIFTIAILSIAAATVAYWVLVDVSMAMKAFTSVLIIACPCAFALSIPFTLGNVLRIFGRKKFYLKNAEVIEKMSQADVLVFDKTGTLTESKKPVVQFSGEELTHEEEILIKSLLKHSTHPLSKAVFNHFDSIEAIPVKDFTELPGRGIKAFVKEKYILLGSEELITGEKNSLNSTKGSKVYVKIDNRFKGYFSIHNPYREGLEKMASSLSKKYELIVLSGDNPGEKEYLNGMFEGKAALYFNQSPHDKLSFIESLEEQGHKTIMIGDGLNDAGALKRSYVGIAVSEEASRFTPACDAILDADSFNQLEKFLKFSKTSMTVIKFSFAFSLIYNILALSMAVKGEFTPVVSAILMPVSSVSLVAFSALGVKIAKWKDKIK
jgi:P-type Cu+ transporter